MSYRHRRLRRACDAHCRFSRSWESEGVSAPSSAVALTNVHALTSILLGSTSHYLIQVRVVRPYPNSKLTLCTEMFGASDGMSNACEYGVRKLTTCTGRPSQAQASTTSLCAPRHPPCTRLARRSRWRRPRCDQGRPGCRHDARAGRA